MKKILIAALLVFPSIAHAEYWTAASEDDEARARVYRATIEDQLGFDPQLGIVMDDTGCPGIDIDAINGTERAYWNVELRIHQTMGTQDRTTMVHLPYFPAHSKIRFSTPCIEDYSTSYSYDYAAPSGDITVGYDAVGSPEMNGEVARALAVSSSDYTYSYSGVTSAPGGTENLLAAALHHVGNERDATALVRAAMDGEETSAILLGAVRSEPQSLAAQAAAAQIKKLKAKQAAPFVDALVSVAEADSYADTLEPVIKAQCKDRRRSVALWRRAIEPDGVPGYTTRVTVLKYCEPGPDDVAVIVEELADDPARLAEAVDALEPRLFDATFAKLKTQGRAALKELMRTTRDPDHFARAAAELRDEELAPAIITVSKTPDSALAQTKVEWAAKTFPRVKQVDSGMVDRIVIELFRGLAENQLIDVMRDFAMGLRAEAPTAANSAIADAIRDRVYVLDVDKLAEAGVDLLGYNEFSAAQLGRCNDDLSSLRVCAETIAADDALAGVARAGGFQQTFIDRSNTMLLEGVATPEAVGAAQALAGLGFDLSYVTTNLCDQAKIADRAHRDPGSIIDALSALDAGNGCAASIRAATTSRERKQLLLSILGLFAIAIPLPATVLVLKRRYRKLLADIAPPKAAAEAKTAASKLAGLDRHVLDGLATARRTIPAVLQLGANEATVAARARTAAEDALRTGDVASQLVKLDGLAVYVVAFPGLHDQPQAIRRHLGASWPEHVAAMRRALAASGGPDALLSVLVFVTPDASEMVQLVGYADGRSSLSPAAIVDARDGVTTTDVRHGATL